MQLMGMAILSYAFEHVNADHSKCWYALSALSNTSCWPSGVCNSQFGMTKIGKRAPECMTESRQNKFEQVPPHRTHYTTHTKRPTILPSHFENSPNSIFHTTQKHSSQLSLPTFIAQLRKTTTQKLYWKQWPASLYLAHVASFHIVVDWRPSVVRRRLASRDRAHFKIVPALPMLYMIVRIAVCYRSFESDVIEKIVRRTDIAWNDRTFY
jgi:hypothetical protein